MTREMLEDLKERDDKLDNSRICQLHMQFCSLIQGSRTVGVYYNELLSIQFFKNWKTSGLCRRVSVESAHEDGWKCFLRIIKQIWCLSSWMGWQCDSDWRGTEKCEKYLSYSLGDGSMMAALIDRRGSKENFTEQQLIAAMAEKKKRRSNFMCDHCVKKRHLKERCYQIMDFLQPEEECSKTRSINLTSCLAECSKENNCTSSQLSISKGKIK